MKSGSFREKYERATVPIGKALAKLRLTPNIVTGLSIVVAVCSIYFFYMKNMLMAFILVLLAGVLDILDGALARALGKTSKLGTLLDNTADRVVEGVIIIGLIVSGAVSSILAATALLAMFLPSYIRARGEAEFKVGARGVGIFERKEKLAILFGILIILSFASSPIMIPIATLEISLVDLLLIALIAGSSISSIQRVSFFSKLEQEGR